MSAHVFAFNNFKNVAEDYSMYYGDLNLKYAEMSAG